MTEPLQRPRRKDPLKKTRVPLLPQGVRSRTALGLTAAAAEGRFQLQVCSECGTVVYPPRDACPRCLSARLLATIERHNAFPDDPSQYRGGWAMDIAELYAMAGVGAGDVDLVQTYDDYPVICMMQMEDLGFCRKGEGPYFVRSHTLTNDGSFPHNVSGGQLSVGQAGAAGGFLGLVEAVRQVTGSANGTQVPDAKVGLVSGFGMINYDRGLASGAAVLAGAGV